MRVLFATPDPNRPGALADALLARGFDWRVLSYRDPAEARQVLHEHPVDAAVVDLATPDAEALLRHLLHTAPGTARLLQAPTAQAPAALRLLALAHGLVAETEPVDAIAERLLALAALVRGLDDPALRARVGALARLPGMPKLYLAVQRALEREDLDLDDVTALVARDPQVAARVLQLANSALFGGSRGVASLPAAVARLGLKTLRQLVLAAELYGGGGKAPEVEMIGRRSLVAAWLAPRLGAVHGDPDLIATAALLAGLGPLLGVAGLDEQPHPDRAPECDRGAAYLLALWDLPAPLQEAVALQRAPRLGDPVHGTATAVHVATALAFDRPVDTGWLERCGIAQHLPAWRELADRVQRDAA